MRKFDAIDWFAFGLLGSCVALIVALIIFAFASAECETGCVQDGYTKSPWAPFAGCGCYDEQPRQRIEVELK